MHGLDPANRLTGGVGVTGLDVGSGPVHEVPRLLEGLVVGVAGEAEQPLGRPGHVGLKILAVSGLGQEGDGVGVVLLREGLLALGKGLFVGGLVGDGLLGLFEEGIVFPLVEEAEGRPVDLLEAFQRPLVVVGLVEFPGLGQVVGGRLLRRRRRQRPPNQGPDQTYEANEQHDLPTSQRAPPLAGRNARNRPTWGVNAKRHPGLTHAGCRSCPLCPFYGDLPARLAADKGE